MKTAILAIATEQMTPVVASLMATIEYLTSHAGVAKKDLDLLWITDEPARIQNFAGGYFDLLNSLHGGLTRYELALPHINFDNAKTDLESYWQQSQFDRLVLCAQGGRKADVLSLFSAMRIFDVATAYSYLDNAPVRLRYEELAASNKVTFISKSCDELKWTIPSVENLGERRGLVATTQAAAATESDPAKRESREFEELVEARLRTWANNLPASRRAVIARVGGGLEWKDKARANKVTDWDVFVQLVDGTVLLFECKRYILRHSSSLRKNVDGKYLSAALGALQRVATSQSRFFVVLGITDDAFDDPTAKPFQKTWQEICDHFALYPRVTLLPILLGQKGAAWEKQMQLPGLEATLNSVLERYSG